MRILVTGGAGYIGSHTVLELLDAGFEVVIVDNMVNSSYKSIERVKMLTNKTPLLHQLDIRNRNLLEKVMTEDGPFGCCIHFAGLKAVGESVKFPWEYYDNNIGGTLVLLDVLRMNGCKNLIFSSSATVYGDPKIVPITEECPKGVCTNPYGQTKSILEQIMTDMQKADPEWNFVFLRYFNPIGAHPSGCIGEDPKGIPNNLMPYITQVAIGELKELSVFGDDYNTHDGTGVRDYIHVVDLAKGHIKAIQSIVEKKGIEIYNLGTGQGYSVLDVVRAFELANDLKIPYIIKERRLGDLDLYLSDPSKAERDLGWKAQYDLVDMCRDSWRWQKNNPKGYGK